MKLLELDIKINGVTVVRKTIQAASDFPAETLANLTAEAWNKCLDVYMESYNGVR